MKRFLQSSVSAQQNKTFLLAIRKFVLQRDRETAIRTGETTELLVALRSHKFLCKANGDSFLGGEHHLQVVAFVSGEKRESDRA